MPFCFRVAQLQGEGLSQEPAHLGRGRLGHLRGLWETVSRLTPLARPSTKVQQRSGKVRQGHVTEHSLLHTSYFLFAGTFLFD